MRSNFSFLSLAATGISIAGLACLTLHAQDTARKPKVVVISLDAFAAESLHDPHLPAPTLHWLMKTGSYATAMQPINPTVTWPNHTAMISGVNASRHHVLVNGLIVDQRTEKPRVDANAPKSELVAVPTVYDAAHDAGLTTAEVDWVAITDAKSINWRFSEKPNPDGPIEKDLIEQALVTREELVHFGKPSQAWRDRLYTDAAIDILQKHHPDLMLLHLLALDGIEHKTGFGNDSGRNTIAFLDDRVKEIVDAVHQAGDLDRTTFLIVSDHGQQSVHKQIHIGVLLKQAGLQDANSPTPTFALNDGGFALLYQKNATTSSTTALKRLFEGKEGVRAALTPAEAAKDGWPTPAQSNQAPDLLLYANDDYAFTSGETDELVTETKEVGTHGYPNTNPLMQAIFIASGAGILPKGQFQAFPNVDVAPTIAKLLHIHFSNIDGKALSAILKQ